MKNKKGSLLDLIYIMIFILAFAIITVLAYKILADFTAGADLESDSAKHALSQGSTTIVRLDYALLIMTVGSLIATIILASRYEQHPALFFASLIFLAICIMLAAILSNVYEVFIEEPSLSSESANFPIINLILSRLPTFVLVAGILIIIALYAKQRGGVTV